MKIVNNDVFIPVGILILRFYRPYEKSFYFIDIFPLQLHHIHFFRLTYFFEIIYASTVEARFFKRRILELVMNNATGFLSEEFHWELCKLICFANIYAFFKRQIIFAQQSPF